MRQIGDWPHAQNFISELAFSAVFGDALGWLREVEGGVREVERAPLAGNDVVVSLGTREARRQQPPGPGAGDIGQGYLRIGKRQVHETVSAEDHVNHRQRIVHEIDLPKLHPVTGVLCLITVDKAAD